MMNNKEIDTLILANTDYKESDALITCITSEEKKTILAKGVQKQSSKNRSIVQPFSHSLLTIVEHSNQFDRLMYGSTLKFFYQIQGDLLAQATCFVLNEIIQKNELCPTTYDSLLHVWQGFQLGHADVYNWACLILRDYIVQEGIAPFIDGCIRCQRTNRLETLSIRDGGFLCTDCNHNQYKRLKKEELIQTRALFRVQPKQYQSFFDRYTMTIDDFIQWANWYEYHSHVYLRSLHFLKTLV